VRRAPRRAGGVAAALAVVALALAGLAGAQASRPNYLGYIDFAADDTAQTGALKRAYNDAVHRYNQSLYDYHVTLEKHDRLVDLYNRSIDPGQQKTTREQATALRGKLAALRRDATANAAAVDEAARRATAGGVTIGR
jgi:hypothetical protein